MLYSAVDFKQNMWFPWNEFIKQSIIWLSLTNIHAITYPTKWTNDEWIKKNFYMQIYVL